MTFELKFPLGELNMPTSISKEDRQTYIKQIYMLPSQLRSLVENTSIEQQNKTYRQGAWNVRELVHHIADSHVELYIALREAITINKPLVKTFDENLWARLPDMALPLDVSLNIIGGIHYRTAALFEGLTEEQWNLSEGDELSAVEQCLLKLNWHGLHHLEHIRIALNS